MDRMIGTLSASFAVLATLLAAVGLYGVLAYTVAQRTREIGVRMALGADGSRVRSMVLRQVGWMTAIGGVIGIGAALALGRAAQSLLFELKGHDPLVVAGSAVLLALVAFGAGYIPARRASRMSPCRHCWMELSRALGKEPATTPRQKVRAMVGFHGGSSAPDMPPRVQVPLGTEDAIRAEFKANGCDLLGKSKWVSRQPDQKAKYVALAGSLATLVMDKVGADLSMVDPETSEDA